MYGQYACGGSNPPFPTNLIKVKMAITEKQKNGGLGASTTLFLIFAILKLTDNITWSWWWVTSPLWIPIALGIAFIAIIAGAIFLGKLLAEK